MAGRRSYKLSEHFQSNARIETIKEYRRARIVYSSESQPQKIEDLKLQSEKGFFPNMPVIFQGDGKLWTIGNAYLLERLAHTQPWEMATIRDVATGLLTYLKFCEDNNLDPLVIPNDDLEKPTYRYVMALREHIMEGLSQNTAAKLVGHMIHFYKHLNDYQLIRPEELGARPFRKLVQYIVTIDDAGFRKRLKVDTTDVTIKRKPATNKPGYIKDGNGKQLRPLSVEETYCLHDAIFAGRDKLDGTPPPSNEVQLCNTQLSIMLEVLLRTGVRKGTMCGLRVAHIKDMYRRINDSESVVRLHTSRHKNASGIQIDPKQGRDYELIFPTRLVKRLYTYVTSERHYELRKRNDFFGDTDENYVFLTRKGNPYISSKDEIWRRQDPESHHSINAPVFSQKSGQSFNDVFNKFVKRLIKACPQVQPFAPHDLRATCGMQLVRSMRKRNFSPEQIYAHVQEILGHKAKSRTTMQYLDFDEFALCQSKINDQVEEDIFGDMIPPSEVYNLKVLS